MAATATQQTYSTTAMSFTFRRITITGTLPQRQCTLAVVAVAGGGQPCRIPCFFCTDLSDTDDYCDLYHRRLTAHLRARFRFIPTRSAKHVADVFMSTVLLPAHESLTCPHDPASATAIHRVDIDVRPTICRPPVRALVSEKATEEDRECAICLETMATQRTALKMPCSHVFHETCLVEWLKNRHVCPLCRYELHFED